MADNRGPALAGVLILLLILSLISTSLRFYSMGVILKRFFVEDWLALVSLVLYCVYTACALLGVHYGVGQHVDEVAPSDRPTAVMWRWIATLFYIAIASLVKLVVGFFLLRICSRQRWQRITIWVLMCTVSAFNIFYIFIAIFACRPVEYTWTRYDPIHHEGSCNSTSFATIPTYVATVLNVLADWILPLLPATLVWKAKMEKRKKISVCAVLALGSLASIASIVRIPYAYGILDNPDYLYTFQPIALWSTVEIGVALTASSLATLTPLFRKIKVFRSTGQRSGATGGVDSHFQGRKPVGLPSVDNASAQPPVSALKARAELDVETLDGASQASDEIELYPFSVPPGRA